MKNEAPESGSATSRDIIARMHEAFVSVDWGTTHLRLRQVEGGNVLKESRSEDGTARLAAQGGDRAALFKATLDAAREKLGAPRDLPVVISGMASSSIGWKELPYAECPFPFDGRGAVVVEVEPGVRLVSGLRSATDIMRGEETEILGAAALLGPALRFEAVMILPGTHSKHVDVIPGGVTGFRTFMTGELFELLAKQSVLRHSVDADAMLDAAPFVEGVREASRVPLGAALFRTRTRQVLDRIPGAANASFLSGVLIGAELASLRGSDTSILLCAGEKLRGPYRAAAEALGLGGRLSVVEAERLAVLGQSVLLKRGPS